MVARVFPNRVPALGERPTPLCGGVAVGATAREVVVVLCHCKTLTSWSKVAAMVQGVGTYEGYDHNMLAVPQLPEGIRIDERNKKLPPGSGVAFGFWFCFMSIFLMKWFRFFFYINGLWFQGVKLFVFLGTVGKDCCCVLKTVRRNL